MFFFNFFLPQDPTYIAKSVTRSMLLVACQATIICSGAHHRRNNTVHGCEFLGKQKGFKACSLCVIKQFMVFTRSALAKQAANVKMATVVAPCDEEDNESNFDYEWLAIKKRRQMLEFENIELDKLEKQTSIQTQNIANRQAGIDSISNFLALLKSLNDNTILDYHTRLALKQLATKQFLASR